MSTILVAVVVLVHAVGHVLFLAPALRLADWAGQTSHSWALTAWTGDTAARAVAVVIWATAIALFIGGVVGFVTAQEWWRSVTIAASIVSIVGIVLFWDGIATGSAIMALAFDVIVLVVLLVAQWPTTEPTGT